MSPATMQFQFDPNQDFQLEAIAAVADLFDGQRRNERGFFFQFGAIPAVPNRLDLSDEDLLRNLQAVQRHSFDPLGEDPAYRGDDQLQYLTGEAVTAKGPQTIRFPNFSVEMETGTGKTYVYLRTALELFRRYAFRKFIIVVPSVAIREGVLKTLQVTRAHFRALFDNAPYRYYAYDSANLSQVRQFALAESVEFMVMTLAAFNKTDINVIHQSTDRLQGETPVHLIQAARPILILDEPQNMESEQSIAALATLNPLFALRYSATHRVPYNVVYRLTPAAAYRRGLVKRIEVASAQEEGHAYRPHIRLINIKASKRTLTAQLAIHKVMRNGDIREMTFTVKPGASLLLLSEGHTVYEGYEVDEINAAYGFVRFANSEEVRLAEVAGDNRDAIFEAQIRYTIQEHIRKQKRYQALGLKVLSLFFIDRVDNYAPDDGIIRTLFNQAFDEYKAEIPKWKNLSADEVQAAYFAQRRTRSGETILEDSKTGASAKDRDAYELIMRDKERLLAFDEPVAFIFTHSALREGWDNPNVFQICTLNQSVSDVKKRQEIGRGVRLAVNQDGERTHDDSVNVLTVIANQNYEEYVRQLQGEITEEYRLEIETRFGKPFNELTDEERRKVAREYGEILPPKPANARRRNRIYLKKEVQLKPEFRELWERISQKTYYRVQINSETLIDSVIKELNKVHIQPPRIAITKAAVDVNFVDVFEAWQMSASKTLVNLAGRYPLPNLIDLMMQLLEHTSPPMRVTRRTLWEIISRVDNRQQFVDNPVDWATAAVSIIKQKLSDQLSDGIAYYKTDDTYSMTQFEPFIESWEQYIVPVEHSAYDGVIVDSDVERRFVQELERRRDVVFYLKLPDWFKVPTPIGNYNPDWAIAMRDPDAPAGTEPLLFLIAETKGSDNLALLRSQKELFKIGFAERHFIDALGIAYRVVSATGQLPEYDKLSAETQERLLAEQAQIHNKTLSG
jgi:type III restriction enzyme